MTDTLARKAKTTGFGQHKKTAGLGVQIDYDSTDELHQLLTWLPNGRHNITVEEEQDDEKLYEDDVATYSGVGDFHRISIPDPESGTATGQFSFRDDDPGYEQLRHLAHKNVKLTIQRTGPAGEEPAGAAGDDGDPPDTGGDPLPYSNEAEDAEPANPNDRPGWQGKNLTALCKHGATEAVAGRATEHFKTCGALADAIAENPNGWWKDLHRIGENKAQSLESALAKLKEAAGEGTDATPLSALDAYGLTPDTRKKLEEAGFESVEELAGYSTPDLAGKGIGTEGRSEIQAVLAEWLADKQ